jgi:arginase
LESARKGLRTLSSHIESVLRAGSRPLTAMGRCACALATLPVIGRLRPEAKVVWFDAHGDCNTPETSVSGYLGGLVLTGAAGLWDTGLGADLNLANVALVGARDIDPAERLLIAAGRPRLIEPGEAVRQGLDEVLGDSPVYVHLDCDVLEPGIVPTEYRVPGGLTLAQLTAAVSVLAQREIVGLEIAEFEASEPGETKAASPAALLDALGPLLSALLH